MRITVSLFLFLAVLLSSAAVWGQVPDVMNYQGKLCDDKGSPVPNGSYDVQFKLYYDLEGGTPVWTSAPLVVNTFGGVFNTLIGNIPAEVFEKDTVYLETLVRDRPLAPRQRITSVGFAFRAAKADKVADGSVTNQHVATNAAIAPSKILGTAWTSQNDGASSGLDADKVDGLDAASFASASHQHNGLVFSGSQTITALSGMTIDGPGNLDLVVGTNDITIKGDASGTFVKIASDGSIQIKAATNLNLTAGGSLNLSATSVVVNGSAMVDVNGGLITLN